MRQLEALDAERHALVAVGTRRIRINAWLPNELASSAPIGPADRFSLLSAGGPVERLDVLDNVLDDVEAMLKFRLI